MNEFTHCMRLALLWKTKAKQKKFPKERPAPKGLGYMRFRDKLHEDPFLRRLMESALDSYLKHLDGVNSYIKENYEAICEAPRFQEGSVLDHEEGGRQ